MTTDRTQLSSHDRPLSAEGTEWVDDLRMLLAEVASCGRRLTETDRLQALRELSGGLAHDLNNTLTGILVRVQLLVEGMSDPYARRQLRMVEQVTSEGAWIVKRLQEFSRTRPTRQFEPVDLNRLVQEVSALAQSSWGVPFVSPVLNRRVNVENVPVPPICGDPVELREALTSLVLTALDAMPEGGCLTFRTGSAAERVSCSVAHTGRPLSEEERIRAFDPMFGAKREKGRGQDLSTAYAAVRRHGGLMTVSSDGQQGVEFTISLPTVATWPQPSAGPELLSDVKLESTPRTEAPILIIDDSGEVRDVLHDLLTRHGHTIVAAEDGESGLVHAEGQPFALAMVDVGLPGISGIEVATRIKLRWPETILVLMTGYADRVGIDDARARGIDAVLTKPFSLDQVTSLIEEILSKGSSPLRRPPDAEKAASPFRPPGSQIVAKET
jgi:CheY-like chemotaxis protein